MNILEKMKEEVSQVVTLTLYFLSWLGFLMFVKFLLLADYGIEFVGFSKAVVGALVLAKVVLVLEYVSMGIWIRSKAAWIEIVLRTALYALGVFIILLLEKGFEGRHEYGSFTNSIFALFEKADIYHIWLNVVCLTAALLSYNIFSVIRKNFAKGALLRMLMRPLPNEEN